MSNYRMSDTKVEDIINFQREIMLGDTRALALDLKEARKKSPVLEKWAEFGKAIAAYYFEHDCFDIDGGDVDEILRRLEMYYFPKVEEPCGEACSCAEIGQDFPVLCCRLKPELLEELNREDTKQCGNS